VNVKSALERATNGMNFHDDWLPTAAQRESAKLLIHFDTDSKSVKQNESIFTMIGCRRPRSARRQNLSFILIQTLKSFSVARLEYYFSSKIC
jgi:hypothetical protein